MFERRHTTRRRQTGEMVAHSNATTLRVGWALGKRSARRLSLQAADAEQTGIRGMTGSPRIALKSRLWLPLAAVALGAVGCGTAGTNSKESRAEVLPTSAQIESARTRLSARETLTPAIVTQPSSAVTALTSLLEPSLADTAADALARIGPEAVSPLVETLRDDDPNVRARAARALAHLGPMAAPAVQSLRQALKDEDARVRRHAARALGQIGPAARAAIPDLIDALHEVAEEPEY